MADRDNVIEAIASRQVQFGYKQHPIPVIFSDPGQCSLPLAIPVRIGKKVPSNEAQANAKLLVVAEVITEAYLDIQSRVSSDLQRIVLANVIEYVVGSRRSDHTPYETLLRLALFKVNAMCEVARKLANDHRYPPKKLLTWANAYTGTGIEHSQWTIEMALCGYTQICLHMNLAFIQNRTSQHRVTVDRLVSNTSAAPLGTFSFARLAAAQVNDLRIEPLLKSCYGKLEGTVLPKKHSCTVLLDVCLLQILEYELFCSRLPLYHDERECYRQTCNLYFNMGTPIPMDEVHKAHNKKSMEQLIGLARAAMIIAERAFTGTFEEQRPYGDDTEPYWRIQWFLKDAFLAQLAKYIAQARYLYHLLYLLLKFYYVRAHLPTELGLHREGLYCLRRFVADDPQVRLFLCIEAVGRVDSNSTASPRMSADALLLQREHRKLPRHLQTPPRPLHTHAPLPNTVLLTDFAFEVFKLKSIAQFPSVLIDGIHGLLTDTVLYLKGQYGNEGRAIVEYKNLLATATDVQHLQHAKGYRCKKAVQYAAEFLERCVAETLKK